MTDAVFAPYWGKTAGPGEAGWHRLAYHCLDVAAVGQACLERGGFARLVSTGDPEFDHSGLGPWIGFLLALHDLGKFARSFQEKRPDILAALGREATGGAGGFRHDALGGAFWSARRRKAFAGKGGACAAAAAELDWDVLDALTPAVFGHHGAPVGAYPKLILTEHFTPGDEAAALAFVRAAFRLFGLEAHPWPSLGEVAAKRLSWGLAGLAVLADWIGSDARAFPLRDEPMALDRYFENHARPQAEAALRASGVPAPGAAPWRGFSGLYPEIVRPSPLQDFVSAMDLGHGPSLHILEDVTGSGKTEAALALVHRLLDADRAASVYVGLPTQATASAMYGRMRQGSRRLFVPGSTPSLVLAHASRDMDPAFRRSIGFEDIPVRGGVEPFEGQAACAAWLADNRKKALLAAVGVGTLDQALLGALPARHQCLRLLGLGRGVLVADEVHAYDPYTTKLVEALLSFQAALGGSAVLLSATLPTGVKRSLARAFAQGLGAPIPSLGSPDYPLVTSLDGAGGVREARVDSRADVSRFTRVERLATPEDALQTLAAAARAGACALYVRNTVDDAVAAHRALSGMLPDRVELFHARFALGDRQDVEARILKSFGRDSTPEQRQGRVVVATQVAEQSLDVDFDLVVSDLAPMECLVQRAGRGMRHAGRTRPEGYGESRLLVVSPDPNGDIRRDWYAALFPVGAFVYPDHARLWLTACRLFRAGGFDLSREGRDLMETVYGDAAEPVPEALEPTLLAVEGAQYAEKALAWDKALCVDAGYGPDQAAWQDDEAAVTRLGDERVTVRLFRLEGGTVRLWRQDESPETAARLSDVSVRRVRLAETAVPADAGVACALADAERSLPGGGYVLAALLEPDPEAGEEDVWSFSGKDREDRPVRAWYSTLRGLEWRLGNGS
ncbi:CRISPR-associated helicase/endonuclease Cas3 [Fundidesulfovibrio butyratiphilus]